MSNHAALLQCIPPRFLQHCQLQHLPWFPRRLLRMTTTTMFLFLPCLPGLLQTPPRCLLRMLICPSCPITSKDSRTWSIVLLWLLLRPFLLPPPPPDINAEEPLSPPSGEPTNFPASRLLSTMTSEEITRLLHHPDTTFPLVCLCDTANSSDTKTHWSAEGVVQAWVGQWITSLTA
jgi:hypothetical protein